jgi:hypothetical protein
MRGVDTHQSRRRLCFYVLSATLLTAQIGIGNLILIAVVTQIITSALIDHLGLFGAMVRPVSGLRAAGIGLLFISFVITQVASQRSDVGAVRDPGQMRQKIRSQTPQR